MSGEPASGGMTIVEVSPRDGLQNDPGELTTGQKIELAARAHRAGLRRIEVTSFVSPKWVPQMANTDQVMASVLSATQPPGWDAPSMTTSRRMPAPRNAQRCRFLGPGPRRASRNGGGPLTLPTSRTAAGSKSAGIDTRSSSAAWITGSIVR